MFIVFSGACNAQNDSYYFKNYQVQNGLSSNTITTILQDKKGFIWIGTRNGLNRFDGNTFKIFHNILSDAQSLGSNSIFSLFKSQLSRFCKLCVAQQTKTEQISFAFSTQFLFFRSVSLFCLVFWNDNKGIIRTSYQTYSLLKQLPLF